MYLPPWFVVLDVVVVGAQARQARGVGGSAVGPVGQMVALEVGGGVAAGEVAAAVAVLDQQSPARMVSQCSGEGTPPIAHASSARAYETKATSRAYDWLSTPCTDASSCTTSTCTTSTCSAVIMHR